VPPGTDLSQSFPVVHKAGESLGHIFELLDSSNTDKVVLTIVIIITGSTGELRLSCGGDFSGPSITLNTPNGQLVCVANNQRRDVETRRTFRLNSWSPKDNSFNVVLQGKAETVAPAPAPAPAPGTPPGQPGQPAQPSQQPQASTGTLPTILSTSQSPLPFPDVPAPPPNPNPRPSAPKGSSNVLSVSVFMTLVAFLSALVLY